MTKRLLASTIIFATVFTMSFAQTVISGTVLNAQGKPVEAYVTVAIKGSGNILGFADTDAKGHYRLEFTAKADSVAVTASGLTIGEDCEEPYAAA